VVQATLLTLWAVFCIYDVLGPTLIYAGRPLIAGAGAGIIVGDLKLGMAIGATMELAALGVYTYGGATIPDYPTGAIVGTALAHHAAAGSHDARVSLGYTIGIPAALLLTALDPVGRFLPVFGIHRADTYALEGNSQGITLMHWLGFIPWALMRAIPTFVATNALNTKTVTHWFNYLAKDHGHFNFLEGMTLVGGMLPAVGFAMLLKLLPVRQYWFFLLPGFVFAAYLGIDNTKLVALALFGLSLAFIYITLKYRDEPHREEAEHV
jgi:mannose/fructose/N-acetylgalactosamine-specific phosphotransferase system component IIC